jgi:multidrug transporter EmrE-like cation transporter
MKASEGFTKPLLTAITIAAAWFSFGLLGMSLKVLPGALLFGVLWQGFESATAFATAAAATAMASAVLVGLAGTRSRTVP